MILAGLYEAIISTV